MARGIYRLIVILVRFLQRKWLMAITVLFLLLLFVLPILPEWLQLIAGFLAGFILLLRFALFSRDVNIKERTHVCEKCLTMLLITLFLLASYLFYCQLL